MRLATVAAEKIADRTNASVAKVRGHALEMAKGVVGFGGTGRELGEMSMRQFRAAQALLRALPGFAETIPKRRSRRTNAPKLEASGGKQLLLFPFVSAFDVGPVRVTLAAQLRDEAA